MDAGVHEGLKMLGVRTWRAAATDRVEWQQLLKKGPYRAVADDDDDEAGRIY